MATVGEKHWRLISTDTAGVPHGGKHGHVDWFEREAGKHGLYIGYNRIWQCFSLFTKRGRKFVHQFRFLNESTQQPVPLNAQVLKSMLLTRERFCRQSGKSIIEGMAQSQRDHKRQMMKEIYEARTDVAKDVAEWAARDVGKKTPKVFSLPQRDN